MLNLVSKKTFKSALLAGTAASAALAVTAVPAFAQDTSSSVEKVTVTGTRLKKRDYNTTSPVTTVGSQTFELAQTTSAERLLNDLPQLVPGNTFTSNNAGGEDFATLDLRGLGTTRTLVLLNGNRMAGSSTTGVADISTIPVGLIDRVEVVTGGASAVYGSDAISGVVNFILKKDYEGMELTVHAGQGERGLGETRDVQALIGGNFAGGNGNITVFGEYFSREGVLQSEFDYSRHAGAICYSAGVYSLCDSRAKMAGKLSFNQGTTGSPTGPWGSITNAGTNPFANLAALLPARFGAGVTDTNCDGIPGGAVNTGTLSFNDAGALSPSNTGAPQCNVPERVGQSGGRRSSYYNFAPDNYIVLPAERYNVSMFGHYDLEKDLTLNFGAIYSDSRTQIQLAATPATGIVVEYTDALDTFLNLNHPDLKLALNNRAGANGIAGDADDRPYGNFTMSRRTQELGLRTGDLQNSVLNLFATLEGQIDNNWSYEIGGTFADGDFLSKLNNSANKTALAQGLAGCQKKTPGVDGILGTVDDVDVALGASALPNCVQLDIFGPGTLNSGPDSDGDGISDQLEFIGVNTFSRSETEEATLSGFISGDLWDLTGAGAIAFVAGGEYRSTRLSFAVDNEQKQGNIYGFNAVQDNSGGVDVYEGYSEVAVPLVKDQPFVYYLGVEAGYRISDYSTVGIVHTYKYGGEYSPFEWLKFRGVYNKATRAPNVFELFQDGDQGFPRYTDPCNDGKGNNLACTTAPGTAALNGALYPGFAQNAQQVQAFAFGNENLSPETAETTTLGLVLQTGNDWFGIGNLRGSVDKYDITVDDAILSLGAGFWITDCYINGNVQGGCGRIVRDSSTGQITSVDTTVANVGALSTEGLDVQIDYRLDLSEIGLDGTLTVNELYSVLDSFIVSGTELVGTNSASIGGSFPEWKSVLRGTYSLGDWTIGSTWTYVPEVIDSNFGPPTCPSNPFCSSEFTYMPDASYVDLVVRYQATDWMSVTLGVDNVEDKNPPQLAGGSQANTDPQMYDNAIIGRSWNLTIKTRM